MLDKLYGGYMKYILFSLLIVFTSYASQISQTQLLNVEQQVHKVDFDLLISNISALEFQLKKSSSTEEKVLIKSQLLTLLSQQQPTNEQESWVLEQQNSKESLQLANPDHPEQLLEIINIARQAKNTQFQWKVTQKEQDILNQWLTQNWRWQPFLDNPTELDYKALAEAITKTDELTIDWLQQQLTKQALENTSNRLLAILTMGKSNPLLLKQLWQNPADQYSYQVLQHLKTILPMEKAIEQMELASKNDKLISQSLLLLTKNYQHHERAQQFLIKKLQQPNSAWHAATALSQASNSQLQKEVAVLAQKSSNSAITFAAKHYDKNSETKE